MDKRLRDLKRVAKEEGFDYEGTDGSDHHVFIDSKSGAVVRASASPTNPGDALKASRQQFGNARRGVTSTAAEFRRFMLKKYKVGKNGSKVVYVTVRDLVDEFNATTATKPITNGHVTVILGQDPMFERLNTVRGGGARGSSITELRISGPGYGLTKEPDEPVSMDLVCGATFQTPQKGIAVCVLKAGHSGLHWDSYRNTRWADGSGVKEPDVEPVIDPVAAEAIHSLPKLSEQVTQTPAPPVLEPVTVGGLTLSDELADQLREALGVPDAAMAAETHDAAIKALQGAMDSLSVAMDALRGVSVAPVVKPRRQVGVMKDPSKIGPVQRHRIDTLAQAVKDGLLPDPFKTDQAMALLGVSEGQMVSTLARAQRDGDTFRRIAPSTYEVR